MFWTQLNLYTSIPKLPQILNANFLSFERYIDVFYDGSLGILTVPIETTGRVKGARGEFVTAVVDNLIVKKQFTNLYDNNTTADYNFYRMYVDPVTIGRDPCTYGIDTSSWKFPYEPDGYKVIDVQKPYYKINNEYPIFLGNDNLSQVVGIYFDSSLIGTSPLEVLLDPCLGLKYVVDPSGAGGAYEEFIAIAYDPSWGTTWTQYKYGVEASGTSGGGGGVGPGTPTYIPMFTGSGVTIGDSSLYMDGDTFITQDISTSGNIYVDGSIILNGVEVGPAIYDPILSDTLAMPNDVGGLLAGTTVADLRGLTLEDLFNNLLFPTVLAYIGPGKINSLALAGISTLDMEVGSSYTPTLTATYYPGQITNGDDTVGPNLTGDANFWTFRLPGSVVDATMAATGNSQAHTYGAYNIVLGPNVWSVTGDYDAGTGLYYDNKTNPVTNLDSQRIADSRNANSSIITGKRYAWRGYGAHTSAPIDSAGVRALSLKSFLSTANAGTFIITIPAGTPEVYFYIPSGKTVVVQYVESSYADVTGAFIQTPINVNDAAGIPQSYTSYVNFIGVSGYPSTANYLVTIS